MRLTCFGPQILSCFVLYFDYVISINISLENTNVPSQRAPALSISPTVNPPTRTHTPMHEHNNLASGLAWVMNIKSQASQDLCSLPAQHNIIYIQSHTVTCRSMGQNLLSIPFPFVKATHQYCVSSPLSLSVVSEWLVRLNNSGGNRVHMQSFEFIWPTTTPSSSCWHIWRSWFWEGQWSCSHPPPNSAFHRSNCQTLTWRCSGFRHHSLQCWETQSVACRWCGLGQWCLRQIQESSYNLATLGEAIMKARCVVGSLELTWNIPQPLKDLTSQTIILTLGNRKIFQTSSCENLVLLFQKTTNCQQGNGGSCP